MADRYTFTETHEHPDGGDRGGYVEEIHSFEIKDGKAVHGYELDCEPEDFGLDEMTLSRLTTK